MSTIFRDHLRKIVECYIDDITVKRRSKSSHLDDLRTVFNIIQAHQLKMNPTKSLLGVSSGKFLGFIVTSKGIHLDPDKVEAIQSMQFPKTVKELRGLQDRIAYIWRFITNLSDHCHPFTRLIKKVSPSYGMKLVKRLSKISKNILPRLLSWWFLFWEKHSCSM